MYCALGVAQNFKVVGYLPYYRFAIAQEIDFAKITHLNLAFINPDTLGQLDIGGKDIDPIIAMAKDKNPDLQVFVSMAGGGMTAEWRKAYDKYLAPAHRSEFVHLLIKYLQIHALDGIDVDLEWQDVNAYYSPFVLELADSLKRYGLKLSAALPATHRYADLTDEALAAFDFINVMAYDATGPWQPDHPGQHSSYAFAQDAITFWRHEGVVDERIILGVPFYGWDFTDRSNVVGFTFGAVVSQDENLAYRDQDGERYYNGIITISDKAYMALTQVGGIMIWELGQDALGVYDEFSLLSALDYVITSGQLPITSAGDIHTTAHRGISVYPNPFANFINLQFHGKKGIFSYAVVDLYGRVLSKGLIENNQVSKPLDLRALPAGPYLLTCQMGPKKQIIKIMKY